MLFASKDRKRFIAIVHGDKWSERYKTTGLEDIQFTDKKYAVLWHLYLVSCSAELRAKIDFESESLALFQRIDGAVGNESCVEYLKDFWVRFLLDLDEPPAWVRELNAQFFYYRGRVDKLIRETFVIPES